VAGTRLLSIGLWLSVFLPPLNVGMVFVLGPTIVRDHDTTVGTGQAAMVLLVLVTAVASPAAENLCRLYGRRRVFKAGLGLYGLGLVVVMAGSTSASFLFGLSVLTGLGSAVLVTTAFSSVAAESGGGRMTTTSLSVGVMAGALLGPIVAMLIVTVAAWQWAFGFQLLLVAILAWLASWLPKVPDQDAEKVDWLGSLLVLIALSSVLIALGLAGEHGWWRELKPFTVANTGIHPFGLSITPVLMALGAIAGAIALALRRIPRLSEGRSGAWRLASLRDWRFGTVVTLVVLVAMIDGGINYVLYSFLPIATDLSLVVTVVILIPKASLALIVTTWPTARQIGRRAPGGPVRSGFLLIAAGVATLAMTAEPATALFLVVAMVLVGAGSGFVGFGLAVTTHSGSDAAEQGLAESISANGTELGIAFGIAAFGSILMIASAISAVDLQAEIEGSVLSDAEVRELARELDNELSLMTETDQLSEILEISDPQILEDVVQTSVIDGMRVAFTAMAAFALIGFLISLLVPSPSAVGDS
jgi:MFS family permease